MKIKKLPQSIKEKAKAYAKEHHPNKKNRPKDLMGAFSWHDTKEGPDYWCHVNFGDFIKAEKFLKLREMNTDAVRTHWSLDTNDIPFFLNDALETNVNEPEIVDPIVEAVRERLKQRSEVGIKKYGTTLSDNNTDDFLNHLQEELMDSILYIEKLKSNKTI
jgi:hypothetical protein